MQDSLNWELLGGANASLAIAIPDASNNNLEKRAFNPSKFLKDIVNAPKRKAGKPHYRLKWNVSSDSVVQGSGPSLVSSPSAFPALPPSLCTSAEILAVIPLHKVGGGSRLQ
jgi:hypothetical protein